ncbi:hypothetical protein GGU10DRAFT_348451 [Lentinula aff. detonsa]|uniref:Uncharacterized protein n=1 Tax=Lentinula aff. detonsa TaxID=2804958 RepID=A0AA38KBB3_9AGAR|nr:hypothetical protein GGU10DRAFT_348451 [Lentinula aff. detonsa]
MLVQIRQFAFSLIRLIETQEHQTDQCKQEKCNTANLICSAGDIHRISPLFSSTFLFYESWSLNLFTMSPFLLQSAIVLYFFTSLLSMTVIVDAGPTAVKRLNPFSELEPRSLPWKGFDPKKPMGVAYLNDENERFVSDDLTPARIFSRHLGNFPTHTQCLVYDENGLFSHPDVPLLYIPEEFTANKAELQKYMQTRHHNLASTVWIQGSTTTEHPTYAMNIPKELWNHKPLRIDCEHPLSDSENLDFDWKSVLRAGGKPMEIMGFHDS